MKRFGCLIAAGVAVVIVLIVVLVFAGSYNGLVKKDQAADSQWAQVENQYQRRYDLIPNLVNAVQGYLTQEKTIFELITSARTHYAAAQAASDVNGMAQAASDLEDAVGRLLVIVEDNPQIKSDSVVRGLMDELAGTENRIAVERGRYNTAVQDYNTAIRSFPTNLLAGMFGFAPRTYFQSSSGANQPPVVTLT
jgi:LemA protein